MLITITEKLMNSDLSSLYIIIEACSVNFYLTQ